MADIDVSFHALGEEIASWLESCADEFHLYLTVIRFPPYQAIPVTTTDISTYILDASVTCVQLTRHYPNLPLVFPNQFYDQNPDALCLRLGKLSDKGLSSSWLSARTSDNKSLAIWKTIARRLKSWTKTGAVLYNIENGVFALDRYQRFSQGARALEARGIVLYEGNGGNIYRFPKQVK